MNKERRLAVDLTIPQWLSDFANEWVERLGLSEWQIALKLALVPGDDPDSDGFTVQYPLTNQAVISLAADAEDDEYWRIVVIHELLHVAHGRIDQQVEAGVIQEMPAAVQGLAQRTYRNVIEPYTHALATALYHAHKDD
jgi:hypothetical protein